MFKQPGIVLESGRGWAIIMCSDGTYRKIKTNQPLYPGQYYTHRQLPTVLGGLAAAVLLFIVVGVVDFFNVIAYASISPGIELGVNRWERVVQVKTQSEDAAQVVSRVDLTGKPAPAAVEAVVSELIKSDSGSDNGTGSPQVSVHSKKTGQELNSRYKQKLVAKINSSVDKALSVQQKIKVKDETNEEKLNIQYKTANPAKQTGFNNGSRSKTEPPGNAWGHYKEKDNNKEKDKDQDNDDDKKEDKKVNSSYSKDSKTNPASKWDTKRGSEVNRGKNWQQTAKDKKDEKYKGYNSKYKK